MPFKRRDDGEIVNEPTEPVGKSESDGSDAPTGPQVSKDKGDDSLFGRNLPPGLGDRLEEPTVPMVDRDHDDKTRIVSPRQRVASSSDTPTDLNNDPMLDPPVGWLVVVRGPGKGRVLTVGNGMNVMGRGAGSRIRIDFGDDTVARANHARLVYEPRLRKYSFSHGDGSNLTYLNGEMVMGSMEIESGAMIEIGESTLRFQAFCSKEFDWPDVDG